MNKFIFLILFFSVGLSQNETDTSAAALADTLVIIESDTTQTFIPDEPEKPKTVTDDSLVPLPEIRDIGEKADKLEPGKPFFELKSSIDLLHQQVDSLKRVISVYEKGKGTMPTIDEELLNLIKVPQLRHRIELQNGTIVNGEIIQEDDLGIIVQTSIGQLAIERDRVVNITEDLPPNARVELVGEPFVNAFPDREEITGTLKNVGAKRADFVRIVANLWSATTELVQKDSVFIAGQNQKYLTGIQSNTALDPGAMSQFKLVIPLLEGNEVSYRTYDIRWESFK
ncbi:MAG: hypothetical protein QF842_05705 [Candidatus Marinimicrobia bacterium]|jgi:hypothetical protein|nr:hypothetical protein [Candidatus Neomarinimicrobiota bacterium]MDP6339805.1 hypothetical protein [Candidatus Neomarinimicrobiota bacterium]MDP6611593.1 hypothetical protein [Candidatus Neomarinimicrobiota bacterium]|tara:strand:- start:14658 stop:15509 length:852 start_codon:yes stop_codon:yes gene_type:complete